VRTTDAYLWIEAFCLDTLCARGLQQGRSEVAGSRRGPRYARGQPQLARHENAEPDEGDHQARQSPCGSRPARLGLGERGWPPARQRRLVAPAVGGPAEAELAGSQLGSQHDVEDGKAWHIRVEHRRKRPPYR
jgi:hypothetical protein